MTKKQLTDQLAKQMNIDYHTAGKWVDALFESIYESLKRRETVTIKNFGTFYIDVRSSGTVIKFSPSQRMRKMLGWSSTYKGVD